MLYCRCFCQEGIEKLLNFSYFLKRGQKHPVNKAGKKTAISLIKVDLP